MDEKTEELRDIFMDVAEGATITERQEESPGTLEDDVPVEERLDRLVGQMRERHAFESSLDNEALHAVARGFYEDASDEEIAEQLDTDAAEVFTARLDLHLLKDADRDASIDVDDVRRAVANPDIDVAREVDLDSETLERLLAVIETERRMRRANYRFRDQFDDILGDGDLAAHLTKSVTDDGLKDATEGLEINTGF